MATPMCELMQCCPVVSSSILEDVLRRQVNAVLRPAVVCSIRLVVRDVRARVLQDLLARLNGLKGCVLLGCMRRNTLDLLSVENRVHAVDEPRFLRVRLVAIAGVRITA